jgi:alkaline phosphatase
MKRRILEIGSITFFVLFFISCSSHIELEEQYQTFQLDEPYAVEKIVNQNKSDKPKNIILMVGDGMSLSVMYTSWVANHGHLNIDNCEYVGLSKTYCTNQLITDSGAGATAFATGYKTNEGSVSVDVNGNPHSSILEIAKEHQLSTGLVATCNILDATPSAFVAHINDRDKWDEIAVQYISSGVDFVCGGGWDAFKKGKDGRDLTKELADKGYQLPRTVEELETINSGKVFALIAPDYLPLPKERGNTVPKVAMKAIELLSRNEKGFFLMIEGSEIDSRAHENKLGLTIAETHDFDRTIGEVLKWAAKDGETLVIILADHECGGLTLVDGDLNSGKVEGHFSTGGHSGVMVPVYSFGPKAETFSGIFENTDVFYKMLNAFGFGK